MTKNTPDEKSGVFFFEVCIPFNKKAAAEAAAFLLLIYLEVTDFTTL